MIYLIAIRSQDLCWTTAINYVAILLVFCPLLNRCFSSVKTVIYSPTSLEKDILFLPS